MLKETGCHSAGRSIFELVDAVAGRKRDAALKILDGLLSQGQAPVYLAAMLSRHFLQLLEASLLKSDGATPQTLPRLMGVHPYAAKKLYQQAAAIPRPAIEAILSLLLSLDHDLKRGRGEPGLLLNAAVAEICSKKLLPDQKIQPTEMLAPNDNIADQRRWMPFVNTIGMLDIAAKNLPQRREADFWSRS